MQEIEFFAVIVIAYFLGNISPSTLIAKAHGINIKEAGSGNAGTTNTLRVLGPKAALATLIIDIGKGAVATGIGFTVSPRAASLCVIAAFFGHIWPILFRFKGGKGVAVAFGAITCYNWKIGLIALAIVLIAVVITRMVSMGSIVGSIALPIECWFLDRSFFPVIVIMAITVLWKHRSNMKRLINGEEDRITLSKLKGRK